MLQRKAKRRGWEAGELGEGEVSLVRAGDGEDITAPESLWPLPQLLGCEDQPLEGGADIQKPLEVPQPAPVYVCATSKGEGLQSET